MPAKDVFHAAVEEGLHKEDWVITHDPLFLRSGGIETYIDLGAEKFILAQKGQQKIAVEIKSFVGPSNIREFHLALGQFLTYRLALEQEEPDRELYLAVPSDIYDTFFRLQLIETLVEHHQIPLIVYDAEQEVIVQWKR